MTTTPPWPWPQEMDALLAAREPGHTHQAPSVMIVDESQAGPASPRTTRVLWMEPEGPHTVENIDRHRYHAIRVEFNQHRSENPDTARTTPPMSTRRAPWPPQTLPPKK